MKTNSYYSGIAILTLLALAAATVMALWPTAGHGQVPANSDEFEALVQLEALAELSALAEMSANAEPNAAAKADTAAEPNVAIKPDSVADSNAVAEPNMVRESAVVAEPDVPAESDTAVVADDVAELEGWPGYEIILRRNIFSRQRTPARQRTERAAPVVVPPDPETYFVLKGVVQEDDAFIAFIEDTQGGQVLMRRAGDGIARGTIKSLTLDSMVYQIEDRATTVTLGCDLKGSYSAVETDDLPLLSTMPPSTGATQGQAAPIAPPSADEAEVLRRLMEQRKQQMGQ